MYLSIKGGTHCMSVIEVKNVSKSFVLSRKQRIQDSSFKRKKTVVSNVSFEAYSGEIFGLLGLNGAGKTTTLRMLSTLIKPSGGKILFDGKNMLDNPGKARENIGFLTTELKLEGHFTADFLFQFFGELHGLSNDQIFYRKLELFKKLGIDDFSYKKIEDLSTGMKQKVSIAVSLIHDPDIIIFDEPTNGLDVLTANQIMEYLNELKHQGKIIIISSHHFHLIDRLCDRVGIIVDGKMVLCQSYTELLKQGERSLERLFIETLKKEGN